jgi:hypothetical protein
MPRQPTDRRRWAVRVSPNSRVLAVGAAKLDGMTIGAWLDEAIMRHAMACAGRRVRERQLEMFFCSTCGHTPCACDQQ